MASKRAVIAGELRQRINSGELKPGDFLPTERKLAETYGVTQVTVNRATIELVSAGLIERVPGRDGGMRVRDNVVITHFASRAELPGPFSESDTFFSEVRAQGFEPSQVFSVKIQELTPQLAEMLEVDSGASATVRRCVRMVNGAPTSIQESFYPQWLTDEVPELRSPRDIEIGTTQLLRQKGFDQIAFVDTERSRMPSQEEFTSLKMQAGTPVLEWRRVGLTMTRAVRVSIHVMSGPTAQVVHTVGDPAALRRVLGTSE